jgi:hypothetical protein
MDRMLKGRSEFAPAASLESRGWMPLAAKGKRYLSFCPSVGVKPTGKLRHTVSRPQPALSLPSLLTCRFVQHGTFLHFQLPNLLPILGNHVIITE